jgi:hypothetical protein
MAVPQAFAHAIPGLAAEVPLEPKVQEYELTEANRALVELKRGDVKGAKVLRVSRPLAASSSPFRWIAAPRRTVFIVRVVARIDLLLSCIHG